jgi:hypothetical protein
MSDIRTRPATKEYRSGFENVFKKNTLKAFLVKLLQQLKNL